MMSQMSGQDIPPFLGAPGSVLPNQRAGGPGTGTLQGSDIQQALGAMGEEPDGFAPPPPLNMNPNEMTLGGLTGSREAFIGSGLDPATGQPLLGPPSAASITPWWASPQLDSAAQSQMFQFEEPSPIPGTDQPAGVPSEIGLGNPPPQNWPTGAIGPDFMGSADFSSVPSQYPTEAIGPDFTGAPQDFSAVPPQQYTGDIGPNYMYNQPDFSAVPPGEAAPVADTGGGIPFDITTGQSQTSFGQQTPFGFGADPAQQAASFAYGFPPGDINTPGAAMDIGSNVFGPDSPLTQPGTDATIPIADTAAQPGTTPGATPGAEQLGGVLIPDYQGGPVPGQQGLEVGAPDDVFQPPNVQGPGFLSTLGSDLGGLVSGVGGFLGNAFTTDPTPGIAPGGSPVGSFTPDPVPGTGVQPGATFNIGSFGAGTLPPLMGMKAGLDTPQFQSWFKKNFPGWNVSQFITYMNSQNQQGGPAQGATQAAGGYTGHGTPQKAAA